jgi:hypothetical protein
VLEAYAVWLGRLSESDRKDVLAATTKDSRLKQIQKIRERQWLDSLHPTQRSLLTGLSPAQKSKRIEEWRSEELHRKKDWGHIRKVPETPVEVVKIAWPFDNESSRNEVIAFARHAFRLDDKKHGSRLSKNAETQLKNTLDSALASGGASWHTYGKTVYDFIRGKDPHVARIEDFLLPTPADPKHLYTEVNRLPQIYRTNFESEAWRKKVEPVAGTWPEFPLEVHKLAIGGKAAAVRLPPLGPARVNEFEGPVGTFVKDVLFPKLTPAEESALRNLEGKWPDYPRELIRLARQHDVSIPGVMLPGSPKRWEDLYGSSSSKP